MTITPRVNMMSRKMTPFFSSNLWAVSGGIFHFCISRDLKNFKKFPFCIMSWSVNHIYILKMTLSNLSTYICSFYITFSNFWHVLLPICYQFGPIPWTNSRKVNTTIKHKSPNTCHLKLPIPGTGIYNKTVTKNLRGCEGVIWKALHLKRLN